MSAATASIADVSRTDFTNKDDIRYRNISGQAQCAPMILPALGTQRIIQGNGTTVGTVISLQCPAKHKLVGSELKCVMDTNSTHWVGETYCKPFSQYEDFGFRVAVLASLISSAIILFMSMAFITCCWVDCIKEDKRKKQAREQDKWQLEGQPQQQEDNRSRYSHKGRNNNNNNTPEKVLALWDTKNPAMCDNMQVCRCHQQYPYGLDREYFRVSKRRLSSSNLPVSSALSADGYSPRGSEVMWPQQAAQCADVTELQRPSHPGHQEVLPGGSEARPPVFLSV
ncbi:hypothetical protein PBY51_000800 [Eleginops maclovinus]|uniref:Sushi domain-containing protein n=1 Tax=Eleginops maclovinus TaxID=56733 RepID=A0AAN7XN78_ELEMC|nr:hypothetical protein PBY51_000800 [Eleginops maclovinus]